MDLSGQSKIAQFNFLVDLKEQSKRRDKNHPVRFVGLKILIKNMLEYELQNR